MGGVGPMAGVCGRGRGAAFTGAVRPVRAGPVEAVRPRWQTSRNDDPPRDGERRRVPMSRWTASGAPLAWSSLRAPSCGSVNGPVGSRPPDAALDPEGATDPAHGFHAGEAPVSRRVERTASLVCPAPRPARRPLDQPPTRGTSTRGRVRRSEAIGPGRRAPADGARHATRVCCPGGGGRPASVPFAGAAMSLDPRTHIVYERNAYKEHSMASDFPRCAAS